MGKDKVYVHLSYGGQQHCVIVRVDRSNSNRSITVAAVVRLALVKQERKYRKAGSSHAIDHPIAITVKDANGNTLESESNLPEGSGFDLFVERADTGSAGSRGATVEASTTAATNATVTKVAAAITSATTSAYATSGSPVAKPSSSKTAAITCERWPHDRARALLKKKQVRAAMNSAEEAIEKGKEPRWAAHDILARAFLRIGLNTKALEHAGKLGDLALLERGKLRVQLLQSASECAGRALLGAQQYQSALTELQGGLRVTPDEDERQCLIFQLLMGKVFRGAGKTTMAYQIFYGIVSSMEDAETKGTANARDSSVDVWALTSLSQILIEQGNEDAAVQLLLRALIKRDKTAAGKAANETLADLFRGKAGVCVEAQGVQQTKVLEMIAPVFAKNGEGCYKDAQVAGPSLAFLATVIKDAGAIEEAIILFEEALRIIPSSTSYALNYTHALEILYLYEGACDVALSFLEANVEFSIPAPITPYCLSVCDVIDVMKRWTFHDGRGHGGKGGGDRGIGPAHSAQISPSLDQSLFCVELDDVPESILTKAYRMSQLTSRSMKSTDGWKIHWRHKDDNGLLSHAVARKQGVSKDEQLQSIVTAFALNKTKPRQLSGDELDLLALLFTIVKISFLLGNFDLIGSLVALIEPVRVGRKLHQTSIRNEAAYYCCVAQLMEHIAQPTMEGALAQIAAKAAIPTIYACGDSHVLPLAWQTMRVAGQVTQIVPRLATGVKAWHLRKESKFYPKRNFQSAVASIPKGARAIFIFCEIDCREGIYVALEKARYNTLEEGIRAVVSIYISVLREIVTNPSVEKKIGKPRHICAEPQWKARGLTIYVHPVLPVLDVTRPLVLAFNKTLEAEVRKLAHPRIHWLPGLYENLLDDDGKLKQRYKLDGTHIHPRYVGERLEPSFAEAIAAAAGEEKR